MASLSGFIVVDDAVEIRVLRISKKRFGFKQKVLIETKVGLEPPTKHWFQIDDVMRCRLSIALEDSYGS